MTGRSVSGRYLRVRELLHRPGVERHDAGTVTLEPCGITSARLADDTDVAYELDLEAQGSSRLRVQGTAQGTWTGPCRRCLSETEGELRADIAEFFETTAVAGETWPIEDGVIDLEPMLRQAMVLELPLAPLCGPDCVGPAPDRYPTVPDDEDTTETPATRDPRWAALDGLVVDEPRPRGADR